jgi:ribosomal-protein-alanine N-acetyltransferase
MKTTPVSVRFADTGDIDRIVAIERSWVHLSHWSVDAYHRLLKDQSFTTTLVAELEAPDKGKSIVGFVIFHVLDGRSEIYNIAVEHRHARLGVGSSLMEGTIELSRGDGARKLALEVRKSNSGAIRFYEMFRFRITGERLNYYSKPVEDAYVMEKDLRI